MLAVYLCVRFSWEKCLRNPLYFFFVFRYVGLYWHVILLAQVAQALHQRLGARTSKSAQFGEYPVEENTLE